MAHLLPSINRIKERGNDLTQQAVERGGGLRERGPFIRARAKGGELVTARGDAGFKMMSLVSGVLAGALAGAIFNRVWRAVTGADEVPQPTALDRSVREVLVVAALQGAVFGLVKAAFSRTTATAYRRLTGNDPTG